MKRLFKSVLEASFPQNARRASYDAWVASGLRYAWRLDRAPIWHFIERFVADYDELPDLQIIEDTWQAEVDAGHQDRLEALEGLKEIKDVPPSETFTRSNFAHLLGQLVIENRKINFVAAMKEVSDLVNRKDDVAGALARVAKLVADFSEAEKSDALNILSSAEILQALGPLEWLCDGLRLGPGGVTMFAGFGDSAKSILCMYLALCVASGTPIFGTYPVTQVRVLWLDYEQGLRLTCERFQRIANSMNIDFAKLSATNILRLGNMPSIYMDDDRMEATLRSAVSDVGCIFFDSFKASAPDTDENSSAARKPLDMLIRVSDGERAIIGIHHSRKTTKDTPNKGDLRMMMRGSGGIYDALQGNFVMYRPDPTDQNAPIRINHTKERLRGRKIDEFGIRVHDESNEDGTILDWGLRVEYVPHEDLIALTESASAPQAETPAEAARYSGILAKVIAAGDAGIAANALRSGGFGGVSILERSLSHLVTTGYLATVSRGTRVIYTAVPGRTTYRGPDNSEADFDP